MRFSDAPSWEALEEQVKARQEELGWQPPNLETVRLYKAEVGQVPSMNHAHVVDGTCIDEVL